MKKVVELIRVSTEGQAAETSASIPAQRNVNRQTAAAFALTVVRSIEMSDVSGAAVLFAPEMKELLRLIQSPDIHGVVTKEFSRLMRPENFSDYALLQAFAESNTVLYLPEGPLDLSTKEGRLIAPIRAAIAGLERTEILERVWHAKEAKRRAGEMPQSDITLPFGVGYDRGTNTWFYKPEAEKVGIAFQAFLAGETSYHSIGKRVGISPYGLRVMLRNPIYTGWRVIDKRRDPSVGAHKAGKDGRQADRRKVRRRPEDIIRIKVIDEPLVTDTDFKRVQQIMDLKKVKHWRTRTDYQHRFTYNNFLVCDECGCVIYTHFRRRDYYICSGRQKKLGCTSRYVRRELIEPQLDELFSMRLTDKTFLETIIREWSSLTSSSIDANSRERVESQVTHLQRKRDRIVDLFVEGLIDHEERNRRLASAERDLNLCIEQLGKLSSKQTIDARQLAAVFEPFFEFPYLSRDQKRMMLSSIVPEIRIKGGQAVGFKLLTGSFVGSDVSRTGTDSLPPAT
ncbi:recombinase family protein [Terriglobus sp. ADX1]|uniref:recombinase family protein n=1 Tax=Terriglobus sp. ADX1 TaxID=2794063 RepID=UPI002FE5E7E2